MATAAAKSTAKPVVPSVTKEPSLSDLFQIVGMLATQVENLSKLSAQPSAEVAKKGPGRPKKATAKPEVKLSVSLDITKEVSDLTWDAIKKIGAARYNNGIEDNKVLSGSDRQIAHALSNYVAKGWTISPKMLARGAKILSAVYDSKILDKVKKPSDFTTLVVSAQRQK